MIKFLTVLFFVMSHFSTAFAEWKIERIYDGDTVYLSNEEYMPPFNNIGLRIIGIDTPEKGWRAKCDIEREQGERATEFFKKTILEAEKLQILFYKWGKYGGRVLGDLIIDDQFYSAMAIKEGLARSYDGGKRKGWCPDDLSEV